MEEKDKLCRIFTGSKVAILTLKRELEEYGISSMVQNDFESGLSAGFGGGSPSSVDLFILESDIEKARPVIDEFIQKNTD